VAYDAGINFFDTAEIYGKDEFIQGLEKLKDRWAKHSSSSKCLERPMYSQPSSSEPLRKSYPTDMVSAANT
jgi:aryl-alcohol dehydrogenase-like predicted oxidoreductase